MTTTLTPPSTEEVRGRGGWRVPLRIARREIRRAKARSALTVLLVMLPVLVITMASTLLRTQTLSIEESLPRELGSSDAAIWNAGWEPMPGSGLVQYPDAAGMSETDAAPAATDGLTGTAAIESVLGAGTRIIELPSQETSIWLGEQSLYLWVTEAPLTDPMLDGMVTLVAGQLPSAPGEVAVTDPVAERGVAIGDTLDLGTYGEAQVVGVVDSLRTAYEVFAAPGGLGVPFESEGGGGHSRWLVTTPEGVSWEDVLGLNAHGLVALSRAVVTDPPTGAELATDPRTESVSGVDTGADPTLLAVGGLAVVMVLLEVVLLAGPAFAVGASRQTRALGLLAAQGATRPHLRRVVVAQAVVLGGAAALLGVALGLLVCWLAYPRLLDGSNGSMGPFEIGPIDLLVVALFGFASAVLAALLPARAAARLDPVRALAGRRRSGRSMHWHAPLGAGLVAAGAAAAYLSAQGRTPVLLAVSALLVMVGAVLLAPLAITTLARLTRRAGFAMRYPARDMARNQLRTAPAVAAVTAVVAGAVALGIAAASDAAEGRARYVPSGPAGDAISLAYTSDGRPATDALWEELRAALVAAVPDSTATLIHAAPSMWSWNTSFGEPALQVSSTQALMMTQLVPWAGDLLIGQEGLDLIDELMSRQQVDAARAALAAGEAVYLSNFPPKAELTLQIDKVVIEEGDPEPTVLDSYALPAIWVQLPGVATPALGILPPDFVAESGVAPVISGIHLDAVQDLDEQDQAQLERIATQTIDQRHPGYGASVWVETGWHNEYWVLLLILGAAAGVLALGGSLTAAKLALSDARADFATLGAVGAPPSLRRRIAGVYGGAIALLGAALGGAVGFIPGIAAAYPLTSQTWSPGQLDAAGNPMPDVFVVIPWGLVAVLVLGLPLVVGLIVMATTRSRLPMVQRID